MLPPLLLALQLVAQGPSTEEPWRWARFTSTTGLPSESVRAVVEGVEGPWAVTEGGVAWYDGFWWNPVAHPPEVPPRGVDDVEPLPGGGLLLVAGDRLYAVTRGGFRPLPVVLDGDTLPVTDAVPLGDGRALVVSVAELLAVPLEDPGAVEVLEPPAPLRTIAPLASLTRTRSGALWLAAGANIWRSPDGGESWMAFLPPGVFPLRLSDLAEGDGAGVLAVDLPVHQRSVWTWRTGEAPRRVEGEGAVDVAALEVTQGGQPLVVYAGAEIRARDEGGWRSVRAPLVPGQRVSDVTVRGDGDVWIATDEGLHLFRASSGLWRSWRHPFPDLRNRVHDILPLPDGTVWIASAGGVEARRPDGSVVWHREAAGVSLRDATGLARGPEGGIWVVSGGGFPGILRYIDGRWERVPVEGIGPTHHFHRIREGPDGNLWFLGLTQMSALEIGDGPGIFALDDARVRRLPLSDSLPSGRIYDISWEEGLLWVATLRGLARRSADGTWRRWDTENGLRLSRVFTVQADGAGGAWFGDQSSGLGHVDATGSTVRYRTESDGLVDDEVWGMLRDGESLWIATAGGIERFDGETFRPLGAEHGLPGVQVWPMARSGDELFLGSLGAGVSVLDLSEAPGPPRVRVVATETAGDQARPTWVTASEWGATDPEKIRTRWRLDDGPWSPWSLDRSVVLTGLAPGDHRFEVQARGLLEGLSPPAGADDLRIEPPIWRRTAFLAPVSLLLVLLASVLALAAMRRREYQRALEASRERYWRFFRDDLTGDFLLDAEGRIAHCNPAFARIFGFGSPEEVVGRSGWDFLPDHRAGVELLRALRSDGSVGEREMVLEHRSGRAVQVIANLVGDFDAAGAVREIRGYVFDDTERKRLQRRLLETRRMESVGRLAGGIAHEFNNLLAAVRGNAWLLLEDMAPGDPRRADLEEIVRSSERGRELTGQLLAFGRRRMMRRARMDVNDALQGMESLLRGACQDHCALRLDRAEELPPVLADGDHLEQVVTQLVLNAREAVGEGGDIRVSTSGREVGEVEARRVEGLTPGRWVVLEVRDDGRGMAEEERNRMFDPFFTTRAEGFGSGGLGLAVVYGLVRQNGGYIGVESAPGRGTAVRVYLPPADRTEEEAPNGVMPSRSSA